MVEHKTTPEGGLLGEFGITELIILILFGLPVAIGVAMGLIKDLRHIVLDWLAHQQLVTESHPVVEIPGAGGFGPTTVGALVVVGGLLVLVGVGWLTAASRRRQSTPQAR